MIDQLNSPGEHTLFLEGPVGRIEAILTVPETSYSSYVAFLGHPHSLQGGTMNNKVVTTLARVFKELHIPSLRFNFRGVGQSAGEYDAGVGESEDMLALVALWQQKQPQIQPLFAGFSFGSYVAYRAASQLKSSLLITIAPPVHHYNYLEFSAKPDSWLVIQGDEDEVVPASLVFDFVKDNALSLVTFPKTGHFFHGQLIALRDQLSAYLREKGFA